MTKPKTKIFKGVAKITHLNTPLKHSPKASLKDQRKAEIQAASKKSTTKGAWL